MSGKKFPVHESWLFPMRNKLLPGQAHVGTVDITELDHDLNQEEAEIVINNPGSLEEELQRQKDQQRAQEQYEDIYENDKEHPEKDVAYQCDPPIRFGSLVRRY